MTLLVAVYLRVSTEEQARKGHSLAEQAAACQARARELAAGQPLELREFVDDFSGDVLERPVLEAAREFVKERRPAYFICLDPDRFSRSLKWQLIVADEIEAQGTRLLFVQQEYDPSDLMSRAFFQFRGLMAEIDKGKILERTSRGKRGKVKRGGRPNGAAPFGYRHNKETDSLEVWEPEARWVRQVFRWVAEEQFGVNLVTRRLNDLGVPCKRGAGRWYRSVVAGLLRNSSYVGEMRCYRKDFRGLAAVRRLPRTKRKPLTARPRPEAEWVVVPVPPIVSRDLFERAQAQLDATSRRGAGRPAGLLSLLVRCGACGGPMSYARSKEDRAYLRCPRRYAGHRGYRAAVEPCPNGHHRAEAVEHWAWKLVSGWLADPDLIAEWAASRLQHPATRADEQQLLAARLASLRREQQIIIQREAQGLLSPEVAESWQAQARWHEQQVLAAMEQASRPNAGPHEVSATVDQIGSWLAALPAAARRHLVRRLVKAVVLSPSGERTVVPHSSEHLPQDDSTLRTGIRPSHSNVESR